jgi:hypothetical protein
VGRAFSLLLSSLRRLAFAMDDLLRGHDAVPRQQKLRARTRLQLLPGVNTTRGRGGAGRGAKSESAAGRGRREEEEGRAVPVRHGPAREEKGFPEIYRLSLRELSCTGAALMKNVERALQPTKAGGTSTPAPERTRSGNNPGDGGGGCDRDSRRAGLGLPCAVLRPPVQRSLGGRSLRSPSRLFVMVVVSGVVKRWATECRVTEMQGDMRLFRRKKCHTYQRKVYLRTKTFPF